MVATGAYKTALNRLGHLRRRKKQDAEVLREIAELENVTLPALRVAYIKKQF